MCFKVAWYWKNLAHIWRQAEEKPAPPLPSCTCYWQWCQPLARLLKWLIIDECTCKSILQTTIEACGKQTQEQTSEHRRTFGVCLVFVCLSVRFQLHTSMFIFDLSQVLFSLSSLVVLDRLSVQRPKNEVIHLKPLTLQRKLGTCTNCNRQMQAIIAGAGESVRHPLCHHVF